MGGWEALPSRNYTWLNRNTTPAPNLKLFCRLFAPRPGHIEPSERPIGYETSSLFFPEDIGSRKRVLLVFSLAGSFLLLFFRFLPTGIGVVLLHLFAEELSLLS